MRFGVKRSDGRNYRLVLSLKVCSNDSDTALMYLGCEYQAPYKDYAHTWLGPDGQILVRHYKDKAGASMDFFELVSCK